MSGNIMLIVSKLITARGCDGSIVFSIVTKFFLSVNMITHEPLHLASRNFAWTCTSTTFRSLLNIIVRGQGHVGFCVFFVSMILLKPVGLHSLNVAQGWPVGST